MATKKITFTITKINNNDQSPIEIEINGLNFQTGKDNEKAKITKIIFAGKKGAKIKDSFKSDKTYQVTFNDCKVEDDRNPTAMHGAFMASSEPKKLPDVLTLESDNKLRVICNN